MDTHSFPGDERKKPKGMLTRQYEYKYHLTNVEDTFSHSTVRCKKGPEGFVVSHLKHSSWSWDSVSTNAC